MLLLLSLAVLAPLRRGGRSRWLLWAIQSVIFWLWVVASEAAVVFVRRAGPLALAFFAIPAAFLLKAVWHEFLVSQRVRKLQSAIRQ